MSPLPRPFKFLKREDGSMTLFGLYFIAIAMVVGGYAVDMASVNVSREKLQATADAVAHAAIYNRDSGSEDAAITAALEMAEDWMPYANYGKVITSTDVVFGSWDYNTQTFTEDSNLSDAVKVTATLSKSRGNPVRALMLQFSDDNSWDLTAESVFTTYIPDCLREGFVGEGVVDLQSNNSFASGFCVHSNSYVSLNNNNSFGAGTVVSMPDADLLDINRNGFQKNPGLESALREGSYNIRILNQIESIIDGLLYANDAYLPDYINGAAWLGINNLNLTASEFTPGRVHYLYCSSGNTANFNLGGTPLSEVVLITNCKISFGDGSVIEDSIIATTSTDSRSISGPNGIQVGAADDCGVGGGATLITKGGMRFASGLALQGGRLIAAGDISFAAQASGIKGASIIAGGTIDGTSNTTMEFCGTGMEANYEAMYFRLAS
jgi:Flp pilus assembly protein TadG